MINLIPPQGHKTLRREYAMRVIATLSFLASLIAVILTVALVPMYVLVRSQINTFELEMEREGNVASIYAEIEKEVTLTRTILEKLKIPEQGEIKASELIREIQDRAPEAVSFKTFLIQDTKSKEPIQIQGVAATRQALIELRNALEESEYFEKAEVPISDLAQDADLPFAMKITRAKK